MAERRSPGAESAALYGRTLDRLLTGTGFDPAIQERVVDAIRHGAPTIGAVVETTGLPYATVERAVRLLVHAGRIHVGSTAATDEKIAGTG